ncbi:MAG: glycine betaine ABC transporter substrate-binding protein, partial [Rhodococcus sp. (in: high G+C Gram-positive bacteria)]|uniref:glycine betaine ABC transporter substrate-binding protein n=1 Tax=Rhodococcus sp. TaxID=1831 RepID=UPI003BAF7DA7
PQGLSIADYAGAEDRSALAVSAGTSERRALSTLEELVPLCHEAIAVLAPDFESGRIADLEGCAFAQTSEAADDDATVRELGAPDPAGGALRVAGVTTASPEVDAAELVLLADENAVFTAQNVVPLYRIGALGEPQIKALNVVAGELTTADLADMIGQVRGGSGSADVARVWLDAHL